MIVKALKFILFALYFILKYTKPKLQIPKDPKDLSMAIELKPGPGDVLIKKHQKHVY